MTRQIRLVVPALMLGLASAAGAPSTARAQRGVDMDLAFGVGFRMPTYDRVNGVSLPWGPTISAGDGRISLDPVVTYRSNLGKFDPSALLYAAITRDSLIGVQVSGGRGTYTNDWWIRSDLINSLVALGLGRDSRNYFRGDRGEARLVSVFGPEEARAQLFAGGRTERDWSTGWRPGEDRSPYSFLNRRDSVNGMARPNPLVAQGHITSAIAGGRLDLATMRVSGSLDALGEAATSGSVTGSFQQLTLDEHGALQTFAGQRIELDSHLLTTSGGIAPAQRFTYVGGSGSLATTDLLALGGDHLYFVDARYVIPVPVGNIPFFGAPYVAPRFAAGAAGIGGYGAPVQNVGVRLGVGPVEVDLVVNPRTHKKDASFGLALPR